VVMALSMVILLLVPRGESCRHGCKWAGQGQCIGAFIGLLNGTTGVGRNVRLRSPPAAVFQPPRAIAATALTTGVVAVAGERRAPPATAPAGRRRRPGECWQAPPAEKAVTSARS